LELFFRKTGKGKPLIILHGLFGSSDNWLTLAKQLAKNHEVIIPDMRNHGQSPHSDDWEYSFMADDIHHLIDKLQLEKVSLLGHSMGGKTAMLFADMYPELLEKLIIVDIAPRSYPIRHRTIIDGLLSININEIASRKEAGEQLSKYIHELGIRQFLLKNLDRNDSGFRWKLNLGIINDHLENVGMATFPKKAIKAPTLFVRGINSEYVTDDDVLDIREYFSDVRTETIGNAGHWVHAEQPEAFLKTVLDFLES